MEKYTKPSVIYSEQDFEFPSHMNYGLFILEKLFKFEKRVALINGETHEIITFGDLAQQIVNVATSLVKLGVKNGDVIGICSENRTEFLVTAIAAWTTEAVVTFLNSAYSQDELIHTMKISKPNYMFLSPSAYKSYYESMRGTNIVKEFYIFGEAQPNCKSFKGFSDTNVNIKSLKEYDFSGTEKTALILYSSGTTGLPKGAKLSHRNLIIAGLQPLYYEGDLVCLSIAPWSNTVGIICTMDTIVNGQTVVYLRKFHDETYFGCIQKYKVGLLLAVPPLIVLLNKSEILKKFDVSAVKIIYCGGAPLDDSVRNEAKARFSNLKHVLNGYGMTEASGTITEEHELAPRQGSVGKIVKGIIIKIADIETGKTLGPNQPGEVCLSGPILFQGYIGKDLKEDLDDEGFYKTGDVAYYDEDGYFYIVDRIKELIKYKAGQVAPSELEAILKQHPAVKDVGVIGAPDPSVGELPTAFVVKMPGVNVMEKELIDFVANKVSSWKQLRGGVRFVTDIPKTPSGKILRRKLRDMLVRPVASKL